jgi:hypothetical protein
VEDAAAFIGHRPQSSGDASWAICRNRGHLCMWDDQAFYFRALSDFLSSV